MKKPIVKRSDDQTTLTISLSKDLKERISEAAQADHRPVSSWCVLRLTEVLNAMDAADVASEKRRAMIHRGGIGDAALQVADEPMQEEVNRTEQIVALSRKVDGEVSKGDFREWVSGGSRDAGGREAGDEDGSDKVLGSF